MTGDFYGVWIPMKEDEGADCLPFSETYTSKATRSFHKRS